MEEMMKRNKKSQAHKPSNPTAPLQKSISGQEQERKIRGDIYVRGEVQTTLPEALLARYRAAFTEPSPRDDNRFRMEKITLGVVTLYAALTAIQAFEAKKGVDVSRDSLESVQRAFIYPDPTIEPFYGPDGKTFAGVAIKVRWENSGSTPSRSMTMNMTRTNMFKQLPENFPFPDYMGPHGDSPPLFVAPKGFIGNKPLEVTQDELERIAKGEREVFMWGWTRYNDVFAHTKRHITRFCYQVIVAPEPIPQPNGATLKVDIRNCRENNCSDDDCKVQ